MARRLTAYSAAAILLLLSCSLVFAQQSIPPRPTPRPVQAPTVGRPTPSGVGQSSAASQKKTNPDEIIVKEPVMGEGEVVEDPNFDPAFNWTMFKGNPGHTGFSSEKLSYPLKLYWKFLAQIQTDNPSSPAVADGVAYFATGRRLYAVNTATGSLRWRFPKTLPLSSVIKSSPLVGEDLVYFGGGDGRLYAVKKSDGEQAWTFSTKGIMNSSPVLANGMIYVGSTDNNLYAIDAITGEMRWTSGFRTLANISCAPTVSEDLVFFLSNDMRLYAAYPTTGRLKWSTVLGPSIRVYCPVLAGRSLIVVSGSMLQSIQPQTGHINWRLLLPDEITGSPAVSGDFLYVACKDKKLYSINTSGRFRWKTPVDLAVRAYGGPIVAGDSVIIGGNQGMLTAVDRDTGALQWNYVVQPSMTAIGKFKYTNLHSSPVVSNGVLYIVSDDGALHAFRGDIPDEDAPDIVKSVPTRNLLIPGIPPLELAALVSDTGSGINADSIVLALDGVPVKHNWVPDRGLVWYKTERTTPLVKMADGKHTVSLSVSDWAGNTTFQEWGFQVDNTLKFMPTMAPTTTAGTPGMPGGAPGGAGTAGGGVLGGMTLPGANKDY